MLPPGHVAFAYLLAKPIIREHPKGVELAFLTLGPLFPAVSNVALKYFSEFGVNHFWSHSPLLLAPLLIVGLLSYGMRVPCHRAPFLLALGLASHLIGDMLFDFPLIYFSDRVDDIGGPWFYPWRPILIRYEEPGFNIQPWELLLEGIFLIWTLKLWARRDLLVYAGVVVIATLIWIVYVPGYI